MKRSIVPLAALVLIGGAPAAQAHFVAAHGAGFSAGFAHPFGGVDHLLAMLAVGLWASELGGRARWVVPLSFVAALVAGASLAVSAVPMPRVELGIAGSVALLGLLVGTAWRMPVWTGMVPVALFALFHGHAHGSELPQAASATAYAAGFVLATATLLGAGVLLGQLVSRRYGLLPLRAAGAVIASVGVLLLSAA